MHRRTVTVSVAGATDTVADADDAGKSKAAANEAEDEDVGGNGSEGPKRDDEETVAPAPAEPNDVDAAEEAGGATSSNVGVADLDLAADSKAFLNASKGLGAVGAVVDAVGADLLHASLAKGSTDSSLVGSNVVAGGPSSSLTFST